MSETTRDECPDWPTYRFHWATTEFIVHGTAEATSFSQGEYSNVFCLSIKMAGRQDWNFCQEFKSDQLLLSCQLIPYIDNFIPCESDQRPETTGYAEAPHTASQWLERSLQEHATCDLVRRSTEAQEFCLSRLIQNTTKQHTSTLSTYK